MNNPVCAACGHVNRVGAVACEACDARLYAAGGADPAGSARAHSYESGGPSSWADPGPAGAWAPGESIPAPPFKDVGDVFSPMLAVYRKHFTLVGLLVLVTTVPEALIRYGVADLAGTGLTLVAAGPGFTSVRGLLLWLLSVAVGALLTGSLVYAVVDLQRAGRASAGECLSRGLRVLPRVFLVSLLYTVAVFVGYVLLIVPGVIVSLIFAVCVPVAVLEGGGPFAALKRSYTLTKGHGWLLFITYFVWGLLIAVLNWVVIWSFWGAKLGLLPALLLQTAVLGMLNSSLNVLTVYVYLGLLRERGSGVRADAFAHGPGAAAG